MISLYGLNNTNEISRAIYLDLHTKSLLKSKIAKQGYVMANTIAKGLLGMVGCDFTINKKDLQRIYESVNISNKLLIFEDVERTGIDMLELMGYVNNLVEHDGARVLLVANESAIIKKTYVTHRDEHNEEITKSEYTDHSKEYFKIKEKTISDTIQFECSIDEAISNILKNYDETLIDFNNNDSIEEIKKIMKSCQHYNLRSFQFGCQKASDIFSAISKEVDLDEKFKKIIFFSIIVFSFKIKSNKFPEWGYTNLLSTDLGAVGYPLFKFCYDYILNHTLDKPSIVPTFKAFKESQLYNKDFYNNDPDLNVILSWFLYPENEVKDHLNSLEARLDNPEDIPFYKYEDIVIKLVRLRKVLNYDCYSSCKKKMIENINSATKIIDLETMFDFLTDDCDEDERKQLEDFKKEAKKAMEYGKLNKIEFNYSPSEIETLINQTKNIRFNIFYKQRFFSQFDADKLTDFVFNCNPTQLLDFRRSLNIVYDGHTGKNFIQEEPIFLKEFLSKINSRLEQKNSDVDKICMYHIQLICENLEQYINELS